MVPSPTRPEAWEGPPAAPRDTRGHRKGVRSRGDAPRTRLTSFRPRPSTGRRASQLGVKQVGAGAEATVATLRLRSRVGPALSPTRTFCRGPQPYAVFGPTWALGKEILPSSPSLPSLCNNCVTRNRFAFTVKNFKRKRESESLGFYFRFLCFHKRTNH